MSTKMSRGFCLVGGDIVRIPSDRFRPGGVIATL